MFPIQLHKLSHPSRGGEAAYGRRQQPQHNPSRFTSSEICSWRSAETKTELNAELFLCAHLKSDSNVWSQSRFKMQLTQVWCENLNPSLHKDSSCFRSEDLLNTWIVLFTYLHECFWCCNSATNGRERRSSSRQCQSLHLSWHSCSRGVTAPSLIVTPHSQQQ